MDSNSCVTALYFRGNFDPEEIVARLGVKPDTMWKKTDLRRDGKPYGFDFLAFGTCKDYDVYVENQMRKTIAPFEAKAEEIAAIRREYDLKVYLEIVPKIYPDEPTPCLAPGLDIIDFCHATRTEIDIDLYLFEKESEEE